MTQCYDEGVLRAYLDDELPDAERTGIAAHLAGCHACRHNLNKLSEQSSEVGVLLAVPAHAPDARVALAQLRQLQDAGRSAGGETQNESSGPPFANATARSAFTSQPTNRFW